MKMPKLHVALADALRMPFYAIAAWLSAHDGALCAIGVCVCQIVIDVIVFIDQLRRAM
jgi:hypothetical protein